MICRLKLYVYGTSMVLGCDKGGSSCCTFLIAKKIHDSYIGPSQGPRKLARFFLTCLPFEKRKHSKDMHHLSSLIS